MQISKFRWIMPILWWFKRSIVYMLDYRQVSRYIYTYQRCSMGPGPEGALKQTFGSEGLHEPHDRASEGAQNIKNATFCAVSQNFVKHSEKYRLTCNKSRFLVILVPPKIFKNTSINSSRKQVKSYFWTFSLSLENYCLHLRALLTVFASKVCFCFLLKALNLL